MAFGTVGKRSANGSSGNVPTSWSVSCGNASRSDTPSMGIIATDPRLGEQSVICERLSDQW